MGRFVLKKKATSNGVVFCNNVFYKDVLYGTIYFMKQSLQKRIAASLLFVSVWSCFGLGLGMIGHSMMSVHASHDMVTPMADAHECCVVPDDASDTQAAGMAHHEMDPVIVEIVKTILFFAFVALVFFAAIPTVRVVFSQRYAVHWDRSISYFALYMQRLFRLGILHPKTW